MEIKGSVKIRVVDSRTEEIKQTIKQNNTITNQALVEVLDWGAVGVASDRRISISQQTTKPSIFNATVAKIIGTGYIPSGISSPIINTNVTPIFGQIQNRIDFTGTARTFTTVALTRSGSNNNQNNESHAAMAYLLLDTPCTQGSYDYLDIFYRIQFLNSTGQGFFSNQAMTDFANAFFGIGRNGPYDSVSAFDMTPLWTSLCSFPLQKYTDFCPDYYPSVTLDYSGNYAATGWSSGYRVDSHFKFKMAVNLGLDSKVGWIFNSMFQGRRWEDTVYTVAKFQSSPSPLQNLFSHSADATVPFFDSLKLANGNGKVLLGGNWQNKWPELYKITITDSGATGTAKYRWSARRHLGFNGNTYSDRSIRCCFRNPNKPAAPGMHGWRDENNDVLRYSPTQVCQYDDTGVTLLDLLDGSYTNWDATTTPALPVTRAQQVAVDPADKKIYVSCRAKGLWVIDAVTNTITNPVTAPCYGVDVGRNGVAFVVTEGALLQSTDWNTPLPFAYAGITDGNWNRVQFLKADPEHPEDRLALVMQVPNSGNRRIVWWSIVAPVPITKQLTYASDGDVNGVCHYLGTYYGESNWLNPHDQGYVTVTMSSTATGAASWLVDRAGGQNVHTSTIANSWIAIDLGVNNRLIPNYYTLRLRGQYNGHAIRNWKFQGCNNAASNSVADLSAATWTDLDVRVNDTTMADIADSWGRYTVSGATTGYRWLRILQTGVESSGTHYLILGEFEFYGQFSTVNLPFPNPANGPEGTNIKPWPASLDVSDSGSLWACMYQFYSYYGRLEPNILTFRRTNQRNLEFYLMRQQFSHSVWGSDLYYKIAFYKNYLILHDRIVDKNGNTIKTYRAFDHGNRSYILHMGNNITLNNREMRHLFSDNGDDYTWENYGYDGSQWVLNHAGTKTTHTEEQPLNAGLTVKFQDGSNTPHFVSTDFYTQSVNWGLLKDNASTMSYSSAWYSKSCRFGHPVQSGLTVPTAAPYTITLSAASEPSFVRIETDSPELIQLTLNGQPVATTYVGGTIPPAPMEVRVDASGNGVVEFNAAQAGAVIGGTYAWIGN